MVKTGQDNKWSILLSINPRVDLAFKKIFGSPENKDLLISFINAVVSEKDQVVDLELLNPYNDREFPMDKLSVLDIKAKDTQGQYYHIEMQINDEADYDKRALYYWARTYIGQLSKQMQYKELKKVIGIHVLNFISIPHKSEYHSCHKLLDVDTHDIYCDDIELHTIELTKFENQAGDNLEEMASKIQNALDRWTAFLTRSAFLENTVTLPNSLNDPNIKKALDVLEHLSLNKKERDIYEDHIKWLRDEASALDKAMEKGIEKGKITVATELLKEGISVAKTAKMAGLPIEKIQELKDKLDAGQGK